MLRYKMKEIYIRYTYTFSLSTSLPFDEEFSLEKVLKDEEQFHLYNLPKLYNYSKILRSFLNLLEI